jgi:hypothetical protein
MVIDFARADEALARQDDGETGPPAQGGTSWLPFNDATWITDRLHTAGNTCPFGCSDAQFHLSRHAGHLAGTRNPAWQRVPRGDAENRSASKGDRDSGPAGF